MNRLRLPQFWRRVGGSKSALALALAAMMAVTAVGTGALYITHAAHPTAPALAGRAGDRRDDPEAASAWFQLSHYGKTLPAGDARIKALQQARGLSVSPLGRPAQTRASGARVPAQASASAGAAPAALGTSPGTWVALGPQPVMTAENTTVDMKNWGAVSGRVTAVAVDPSSSSDVWLGTADGGVWHSTDGGTTWTPVSDGATVGGSPWPTLSIGSIAIDASTTPHTIYVGTGEANGVSDGYWGVGILKSSDDGATWTEYGFADFAGLSIGKIAIDPSNHLHLLAAVDWVHNASQMPGGAALSSAGNNVGIWQSSDGGQTWSELLVDTTAADPNPDVGTDVLFDPANPSVAFAALGNAFHQRNSTLSGIWKITFGASVTKMQINGFLPSGTSASDVERASLAISPDGAKLYAVVSDADVREAGSGEPNRGNLLGKAIYALNVAAGTWSASSIASVGGPMWADDDESQWWYDLVIAVDPTDSSDNTVYVGGVELWRTSDGGATWADLTDTYNTNPLHVHPDEHAIAFAGSGAAFYDGNDGGVWSCDGAASISCSDLNGGGLNLTQFYGGAMGDVGSGAQLYGGSQDNGVAQYPLSASNPAQWNQVYGDDGGEPVVDFTNNLTVYEQTYFLGLHKSTDGGTTWTGAGSGINYNDAMNFMAPLAEDPTNHLALVAGTDRVYRTTNGAASWSAISPVLDSGQPLSALAVAPSNGSDVYTGDNAGHVYATSNGDGSWHGGAVGGSTGGMVRGLAVDPTNPSVVYAAFAQFASGSGGHIFKSTNAGVSWTDISKGLPNIPFASVLVDPNNTRLLIAGSDVGVFESPNGGATWYQLGTGLPPVAIDQVFTNHSGTRLFVATHGRGMWELDFPDIALNQTAIALTTAPGQSPAAQTVQLANHGLGTLNWSSGSLPSWVSVSPSAGSLAGGASTPLTVSFSIAASDGAQTYTTTLQFSAPNADNAPLLVPITVVATAGSKTWYFAEGYTGGNATEYLTLANPNPVAAHVTVQYLLGAGSPITKVYPVGAEQRSTVIVNSEVGRNQNVSMVVTADQPIVAERPYYVTYTSYLGQVASGTDVLGATSLAQQFDFATLDTSAHHETWLTILNPQSSSMTVSVSYFPAAGGAPLVRTHPVAGNRRGTIFVNGEAGLPAGVYSALVSLSAPGLVERPLYETADRATGYPGAADVVGVAQPLVNWYFAEGYTSPTVNERYVLANPTTTPGTVSATVTLYRGDGSSAQQTVSLGPGQQQVVDANALLGTGGGDNSAVVTATAPILAERVMSQRYVGYAGCCHQVLAGVPGLSEVLGAAAPSHLAEFAEGYTGGQVAEYLTLENPSPTQDALVTVSFLPRTGGAPTVQTYPVAAHSRYTLYTNSVLPNQWFAMLVVSDVPIVAERPEEFLYNGWASGSTDVIGFQPLGG